jgi:hypothetical protein
VQSQIERLCTKTIQLALGQKKFFSRKGAKRYRVSKGFLCAFAPLRETSFVLPARGSRDSLPSTFQFEKGDNSNESHREIPYRSNRHSFNLPITT